MKVLMCTDGSKFAEEAIESASALLRVVPNFEEEYKEYGEYAEMFREEMHKLRKLGVPKSIQASLDKGVEILAKQGIRATSKTRKGRAADEILNEAEEGSYNLIVLASYGRGITKFMLGSVSREVVHRAQVPVLVVKGREGRSMM